MSDQDQLPPHCEAAEWLLVACALENPAILPAIESSRFYCEAPRSIIETAQAMHVKGIDDPQVPVLMGLSRSAPELFLRMQQELSSLPSPENWTNYQIEIEEQAGRRDALQFSASISAAADAGTLDVGTFAEQAKRLQNRGLGKAISSKQCAALLTDRLEKRFNLDGARSGLVTGFDRFDDLTDGLQSGEQTIIAARPSVGKTALACNMVERICLRDHHATAFVTLEMSPDAIASRILSSWANIPMWTLRNGQFNKGQFAAFPRFQDALKKSPLHMLNGIGGLDINQICGDLRKLHRDHNLKLVVIDYLQKIRPSMRHEKRTYEVGEVSGMLRALAVEIRCAFVTLAQLNREPEKDKGRSPRLSDLADSGQIERDADCVGLLHRDKSGDKSTLTVAKQRDGETGTCDLKFNGTYCRFENMGAIQQQDIPDKRNPTND